MHTDPFLNLFDFIFPHNRIFFDRREVLVLAGTAKVHAETILHLRMLYPCYTTPLLNELRGGDLHGLSPEEIENQYPEEHKRRQVTNFSSHLIFVITTIVLLMHFELITCFYTCYALTKIGEQITLSIPRCRRRILSG